jgi:GH25 family lysozyme M1 (1,4-beta-N-acetylmuramidase)
MPRLRGLDVSACQGLIDFDKLPKKYRFLVVKVSEGESYKDPIRLRNLAEARARGLRVFVYAFLRTSQDPEKQAQNLWDAVGDICPSFVFVDFETIADGLTPAQAVAKAVVMTRAVRRMFGRCGVYLFPWFCTGVLGVALHAPEAAELAVCALWMADYRGGEEPPEGWKPFVPLPWHRAMFVQTSGDKSSFVPGIVGHVDHDYFDGDEDDLNVFLGVPTADQLEPDAPIVHVMDYASTDDPPFEPDPPDAA